jgi:hypothetical protein
LDEAWVERITYLCPRHESVRSNGARVSFIRDPYGAFPCKHIADHKITRVDIENPLALKIGTAKVALEAAIPEGTKLIAIRKDS